jgi:hypothetical protein
MRFLKLFLAAAVFVFMLSLNVFAQEEKKEEPKYGWQNEVVAGLNLTQTSFDNWSQGGENSLAWQFNFNAKFINDQEKYNWSNTGKLLFGRTKVGSQDSRKSIDEIKLESVYTYKLTPYVNPYVSASAQTQLMKGYKYTDTTNFVVSNFFDPAYFIQSAGIGYTPNEDFTTRIGAAVKETVTRDYPVPYADDPDTPEIEKTKVEPGMESVTNLNVTLAKNILFTTNLQLFSNMKAFNEIDVNWDNLLVAKVNDYINVNFNLKLFYDRDISTKRQLMQSLALGLTYTLL